MSGLFSLLFTKLTLPPPSLIKGKTILITGANTGLGRETARHALALGAGTIILGVRSISKGEDAKANIEASVAGCNDIGKILVWPVDLESFASVQAFAAQVHKHVMLEGGRLDIAIMNAGIASAEYSTTHDGWERGIQVNVLSTALLSLKLLPLLLQTKERDPSLQPHLVLLTSDIHKSINFSERNEKMVLSFLNREEQWKSSQTAGATERYGVTKLMDIFITMELARLVPRDESGNPLVIVNAVAPGFCKSDLLTREKAPWILKLIQALIARTVEEGSKTLLHAATQGTKTHGKWLENQINADPGTIVTSQDAAVVREKVWAEIIAVLHNADPEVRVDY
ncbi:retinol dehydrogenase 14 [Penicillium angulare]|uniref:retinol dehydrogenase 14 n=1 Tax=Penicillium angulare TaxID=116970 RepID=UPI002541C23C|nr:retinol dehydrogenase 14 [Penicillium angulare]KAJ5291206.1 retinol dehydrogenase 14 [Penicillium angulare]